MGITRERDNGKDVVGPSDLVVMNDGFTPREIVATPRVGIRKAVDHPLRFVIAGNEFISGKRVRASD
jgi:DNA-3-methyladenine glycosylase